MIKTKLPNKKRWADQLNDIRKANKIQIKHIMEAMGSTYPTMKKALEGDCTYDRLEEIENTLEDMIYA